MSEKLNNNLSNVGVWSRSIKLSLNVLNSLVKNKIHGMWYEKAYCTPFKYGDGDDI